MFNTFCTVLKVYVLIFFQTKNADVIHGYKYNHLFLIILIPFMCFQKKNILLL